MKTMDGKLFITFLLAWSIGLWYAIPGRSFPLFPPRETLAGLTPGINTLADASRIYGSYDVALPGIVSAYSGGPYASKAYRWNNGVRGKVPGLVVETHVGSTAIIAVMIDEYPGLGTSNGLMAWMPESQVLWLYGRPDYAFELRFNTIPYLELIYIDRGLLVMLAPMNGLDSWTVSKIILTYPTNLRNAVALRGQQARKGNNISNVTEYYQDWMQSLPTQPAPALSY